MSRILKLEISGIRSFPQDRLAKITFTPPLTLFLGHNGCGKTTIIEALKCITTSEMPPGCGQGASFIHDPKIAKDLSVKAQIKLKVKSAKNEKIDYVKSMEVTQKAKKLEFKTLEQTITRIGPDGSRISVSNKCVDFQLDIIQAIGVSKPILENVIFCHQEESNWPLDENKKVKEKFDAIFNATKYIKCLQAMQKLRKEKKLEVKHMQETLNALRDMKEEADKKKADLLDQQQMRATYMEEQATCKANMKPINARLKEIMAVESNIIGIREKKVRKESQIESLTRDIEEGKSEQRHTFDCSDEEMHRKMREYATTIELQKNNKRRAEENWRQCSAAVRTLMEQREAEQRCLARLDAQLEQHTARLGQRRLQLGQVAATVPALAGYQGKETLTESEASDALQTLEEHITAETRQHEALLHRHKQQEQLLQKHLDALRMKEATLAQEVNGVTARITTISSSLTDTNREVLKLKRELDSSSMEAIEQQMEQLNQQINNHTQTLDQQKTEDRITTLQAERLTLSSELKAAKRTLMEMNRQAEKRKELQMHTATVEDCNKKITQLFRGNQDMLDGLFGGKTVTAETVKMEFVDISRNKREEMARMRGELQAAKDDRSKNQSTIDSLRSQEEDKERDIRALEKRLNDQCPEGSLEDALKHKKEQFETLQREMGELESGKTMTEAYIRKLAAEDCCPLCHRDFASKEENMALRNQLTGKVDTLPQRLESARKRKEAAGKQLSVLQELGPFKQQLNENTTRLRRTQAELSVPLSQVGALNSQVEDLEDTLNMLESDNATCRSLQEAVTLIDTHRNARCLAQRKCDAILRELGTVDGEATLESATARVTQLEEEYQTLSSEVEQLQSDLVRYNKKRTDLDRQHTDLERQQIDIQRKQSTLEQKQRDMERLQQEHSAEQAKVAEKTARLTPAKQAVRQQQEKLNAAKNEAEIAVRLNAKKVDRLREALRPLKDLHDSICNYLNSDAQVRLIASRNEMERLSEDIAAKQRDASQHEQRKQQLEKELTEQSIYESSMKLEKKIRDKKKEIEFLRVDVENLEKQVEIAKIESLHEEKSKLTHQWTSLDKRCNSAAGRADEVNNRIHALEADLNQRKYKDAVTNYHTKMLTLKCTEIACEDLNKYYTALDTSVMRFHGEKMKAINRTIRQLWTATYKGNDVDRIEIKTDDSGSKGLDSRRVYNYRVVMHKNGAEMDMRGRCSAGQKVLASLIIRMALAETFSKNCGVLALDEPTTNLDRENIRALSDALGNIVQTRAVQSNFQLIVITHDVDFLQGIMNANYVRSYYNVFRDEHGMSNVKLIFTGDE